MLIAILSDIHDHLPNLRAALDRIGRERADALLCCGDLNSPFVVDELAGGFPNGPIHVVFGNNDGDRFRIAARANATTGRVSVQGESVALELGGCLVFVHHFDDVGSLIAAAGRFDLVCYGHNHQCRLRQVAGGSLEVNPGTIMGWHPRRGDIRPTFALYNTETKEADIRDALTGEPATGWCGETWST